MDCATMEEEAHSGKMYNNSKALTWMPQKAQSHDTAAGGQTFCNTASGTFETDDWHVSHRHHVSSYASKGVESRITWGKALSTSGYKLRYVIFCPFFRSWLAVVL